MKTGILPVSGPAATASQQNDSPTPFKKGNVGGAIAEPTGSASNMSPEAYFKDNLEPALKSAVAAGIHGVVVPPRAASIRALRRVFVYVRGSTQDQEDSIFTQLEDILRACEREDFEVVRIFWDLQSGTKGADRRPGLAALKQAAHEIQAGSTEGVVGVIVWHMNRFSRDVRCGLLDLFELSDAQCPVIFPRRRGRLQVANMDDSNDIVEAVIALADAADDLDEHVAKIRRGLRSLLRKGIHPSPGRDSMYWIFIPSAIATRRGRPHKLVAVNPNPIIPYRALAAVLVAFPEYAVAQTLARLVGRTLAEFLEELQLRWAIGDFRFGVALDDPEMPSNPRPIAVTDDATFSKVSTICQALHAAGRTTRREVQTELAIKARTIEYWVRLRRQDIMIRCGKPLGMRRNGKPKSCGAPLRLKVASSTEHPGKDVLECCNGHTRIWPPNEVLQEVASDRPPFCARCGVYDHVEIDVRRSSATCTVFECKRCALRMQAFGNLLPRPGQKHKPRPRADGQATLP
ncbi:MAG: recombinase family protein [bacterium]